MFRRLLRRYPDGKVWLYDENGSTYFEERSSMGDNATDDSRSSNSKSSRASHHQRRPSPKEHRSDSQAMQNAFPGARCIAVHGIYDYVRKRWAVGSLFWSYDPFRILTLDTEMHFVNTFCDIIMAETSRLEAIDSDKAKSNFMSSISHELRSPLHGILGSAEILSDLQLKATESTLVQQIDSCGHTLLQIIDHLLEFANLRSTQGRTSKAQNDLKIRRKTPNLASAGQRDSADEGPTSADVPLDTATEEAVASAAYSFYYNQSDKNRNNVPVILDIDHQAARTWLCALPVGGWKRVCLNLVTNSLKYTSSGFVHVELKQEARPGFRGHSNVVLTVSDSGIGMSEGFQKKKLFQDFCQEDTLASGLGLGMHMVSQMLTQMGGKIEVSSSTGGSGTRMTVTAPLGCETKDGVAANGNKRSEAPPLSTASKGLAICAVLVSDSETPLSSPTREDVLHGTASKMGIISIEKKCKFLGAKTNRCSWRTSGFADLRIVAAADAEACFKSTLDNLRADIRATFAPILVVCDNIPAERAIRDRLAENRVGNAVAVECVALPCSVKQLDRAIEAVMQLHKSLKESSTAASQPSASQNDTSRAASVVRTGTLTAMSSSTGNQAVKSDALFPVQDNKGRMAVASTTCPSASAEYTGDTETTVTHTKTTNTKREGEGVLPHRPKQALGVSIPPKGAPNPSRPSHSLPRSRASASQASPDIQALKQPPADTTTSAPSPTSKDPTFLIVDDNPINLQLLKVFFQKAGYAHATAADGELAVSAFRSAHEVSLLPPGSEHDSNSTGLPNIILMDISMPVMDGYEATQHIRAYEKKHSLPASMIIAITAMQSETAYAEAYGSGFDMFLSKPVKLKELARVIKERWGEGTSSS